MPTVSECEQKRPIPGTALALKVATHRRWHRALHSTCTVVSHRFQVLAMSAKMEHSAKDLPANLPSQDSIVQYCAAAGYRHSQHGGFPQFWIKYGTGITVTLGEVLTQDQVARIVKTRTRTRTPGCGCEPSSFQLVRVPEVYLVFSRESCRYIAMQYVAGDTVARGQPR